MSRLKEGSPRKQVFPLNELTAISILDGRNRKDIVELTSFTSEFNLIRKRIGVEAEYLIALSDIGVVRSLSGREKRKLQSFGPNLTLARAQEVKRIEDVTQHDVKAMERSFRTQLTGTSLEDLVEMVHFGLTSGDPDNLSHRLILKGVTREVFIPTLDRLTDEMVVWAEVGKRVPMLARTHGQAAVPTTLGKEFAVYATRLNKEVRALEKRPLFGKLTGAVGNLNALKAAHPEVDWLSFSENFVRSLGLEPNLVTTQMPPYEDMIEYFQNYKRINGIVRDFDQDLWRYISDHWLVQVKKEGEVGSSTMPQKINPWRLENSEANAEKADALFECFARELATSRLQRDLSDSSMIRDMGVPLGWSLLAYKNTLNGLSRARLNEEQIRKDLNNDWTIIAEGAQTMMRRFGIEDPYSMMADLTRGRHIGEDEWREIVSRLPVSIEQRDALHGLTPETYIGLAVEITDRAINDIKTSRTKKGD